MPKVKLTDLMIRNEVASERCEYYDTKESGLILRISPSGKKTFAYRYSDPTGKKVRMTIGNFPSVSLSEARKMVAKYKNNILHGNYPRQEVERKKQEIIETVTFTMLAERYIETKSKDLRDRTWKEYKWIINKELEPTLGNKDIKRITKTNISEIFDKIADSRDKPTLANRVLMVASGIFTYAMERDLIKSHPVKGIKKKERGERVRTRVYTDEEIRAIWEATEQQADPVRTLIKFMFATGQRKNETTLVRWDQINFKKRTWFIPKDVTKNKTDHLVPLSSLAIDLLKEIEPLTGGSDFVFVSPRVNKGREYTPIKWLEGAKNRIKTASGVNDFMYHNIRRTFTTRLASRGVERTTLGKLLNHKEISKDNEIIKHYDQSTYMDQMRLAVENWGAELMRIVSGEEKEAKVTRIGGV